MNLNQIRAQNELSSQLGAVVVPNPFENFIFSRDEAARQSNNFIPLSLKVKLSAISALKPMVKCTGAGGIVGGVFGVVWAGPAGILPGLAIGGGVGLGVGGIAASYTFYQDYKLYVEMDLKMGAQFAKAIEPDVWEKTACETNILFRTYIEKIYPGENRYKDTQCPIGHDLLIFPVKTSDGRTYEYQEICNYLGQRNETRSPLGMHENVTRDSLQIDVEKMAEITNVIKEFKKDLKTMEEGTNLLRLTGLMGIYEDDSPVNVDNLVTKLGQKFFKLSFNEYKELKIALKVGVETYIKAIDQRTDAVYQAVTIAIMNANIPMGQKLIYNQEILAWANTSKEALK